MKINDRIDDQSIVTNEIFLITLIVIDCYQLSSISRGVHGHPQENSPGYPDIDLCNPEMTERERTMSQERAKVKDVTLVIKCVVKGYHACDFTVEYGEAFVSTRKRGKECGNAFKVINQRVQTK